MSVFNPRINEDFKTKIFYKPWKFASLVENRLWERLNTVRSMLEYDWFFRKYEAEYENIDSTLLETEDVLTYDMDSFRYLSRAEEELEPDPEWDINIFNSTPRSPHLFLITYDYYELLFVYSFLAFLFFKSFYFLSFIFSLFFFWPYLYNFHPRDEETDTMDDAKELYLENIYDMGLTVSKYSWINFERSPITVDSLELSFYLNSSKYDNNLFSSSNKILSLKKTI